MSDGKRPHVLFHDGSAHTEGIGAKWREVKYAVWLALRVNWLLQSQSLQNNATLAWLPNPAMMQNPHLDEHRSMMGGLGILDAGAPVLRKPPAWLEEQVHSGALSVVELKLEQKKFPSLPGSFGRSARTGPTAASDRALERQMLDAITSATQPIAFMLRETQPMHWHGSAGRWLHDAFISHRLRRAQRATGHAALALPAGVAAGSYLISVHIRAFGIPAWDLPASYFVSAVQAVFDATPLSCANTAILVIGPVDAAPSVSLAAAFECTQLLARAVEEPRGPPTVDPRAGDDYGAADDDDDERRGLVHRDLDLISRSATACAVSDGPFLASLSPFQVSSFEIWSCLRSPTSLSDRTPSFLGSRRASRHPRRSSSVRRAAPSRIITGSIAASHATTPASLSPS